jgi:Bacteriophage Mu Gam like protein
MKEGQPMTVPLPDLPPAHALDEPDYLDDLEDAKSPDHDNAREGAAREPWVITSEFSAEGAMRRLRRLTQRVRDVKDQAATWREPIDDWERDELARLAPGIEFLSIRLEAYAIERREADPRTKTIRVPSGEIPTRRAAACVKIIDDETFVDWAAGELEGGDFDEVVDTKLTPKVRAAQARLSIRYEPDPWCRICGTELVEPPEGEDVGWRHLDEAQTEDHAPEPGTTTFVAYVRASEDGEAEVVRVRGVAIEPERMTATVKPLR